MIRSVSLVGLCGCGGGGGVAAAASLSRPSVSTVFNHLCESLFLECINDRQASLIRFGLKLCIFQVSGLANSESNCHNRSYSIAICFQDPTSEAILFKPSLVMLWNQVPTGTVIERIVRMKGECAQIVQAATAGDNALTPFTAISILVSRRPRGVQ
jgi:hypothetical protein